MSLHRVWPYHGVLEVVTKVWEVCLARALETNTSTCRDPTAETLISHPRRVHLLKPMSPQFSEEDIEEEQVHFSNVVATFQQYAQHSVIDLVMRRSSY